MTWKASYGASGDQSRAVVAGLEADYVHFSLDGDVTRLVEAGLVAPRLGRRRQQGHRHRLGRRARRAQGQPEGHQGLGRPGRSPTSASSRPTRARPARRAGTSSPPTAGASPTAVPRPTPKAYLTEFFDNIVALPGSGRDATTAFLGGTGDVLISYENEAILARQNGEEFDYVVPDSTLLIENPGAVLMDADPKAKAYLDFVLSDEGQKAFVSKGFRPISGDVDSVGTSRAPTTRATRSRRPSTC